MIFSLYAKLAAVAVVAVFLAGTHWKAYRSGQEGVRLEWQADIAQRTADALQAEQAARAKEQELTAKVGKVERAYQDQKRATAHVAAAAGVGLRNLESALSRQSASSAATSSGIDDPRDTIIRECTGALVALDGDARRLADKTGGLQDYAGVCSVSQDARANAP